MASRSGGTPIRNLRKVKSGPDQAFTLPKGTSAAPIKNVPVKVKAKTKTKSEPKKIITKTKPKSSGPKQKKKLKKKEKKIGWSKPSIAGGVIGIGGTAAALTAIARSQDKYRKHRP